MPTGSAPAFVLNSTGQTLPVQSGSAVDLSGTNLLFGNQPQLCPKSHAAPLALILTRSAPVE